MKKIISATSLALLSITATAQLIWQKGGNTTAPLGAPSTLGTNFYSLSVINEKGSSLKTIKIVK